MSNSSVNSTGGPNRSNIPVIPSGGENPTANFRDHQVASIKPQKVNFGIVDFFKSIGSFFTSSKASGPVSIEKKIEELKGELNPKSLVQKRDELTTHIAEKINNLVNKMVDLEKEDGVEKWEVKAFQKQLDDLIHSTNKSIDLLNDLNNEGTLKDDGTSDKLSNALKDISDKGLKLRGELEEKLANSPKDLDKFIDEKRAQQDLEELRVELKKHFTNEELLEDEGILNVAKEVLKKKDIKTAKESLSVLKSFFDAKRAPYQGSSKVVIPLRREFKDKYNVSLP